MSTDTESVDYYDKLILYYLLRTKSLPNQSELAEITKINYRTLTLKVQKLRRLSMVQTDTKGRQKVVSISLQGEEYIENWKKTKIAEKTIAEFDNILKNQF